jgi:hypothetical protein
MPTPNFGAALGDAAWMTGLERNSDLIVMASYAPLLVNVNPGGMQWESDLIGYDALRATARRATTRRRCLQFTGTFITKSPRRSFCAGPFNRTA